MRVLAVVLRIVGVLVILMGLLWIGQGTGLIMWPKESFMLAHSTWARNGAILAAVGVAILLVARRLR